MKSLKIDAVNLMNGEKMIKFMYWNYKLKNQNLFYVFAEWLIKETILKFWRSPKVHMLQKFLETLKTQAFEIMG